MRKSTVINPGWIYVLALEKGNFYVGETGNLKRRLHEHVTGLFYDYKKKRWCPGGAVMSRKLKPQRLIALYRPNMSYMKFQEYVAKFEILKDLETKIRKVREKTEKEITLHFMEIYGINNVKGAHWCCPDKNPTQSVTSEFDSIRPLCKCPKPTERVLNSKDNIRWVCGAYHIHDTFGPELIPSEQGLILNLKDGLHIPVALSCDCDKSSETKRFLPENKE